MDDKKFNCEVCEYATNREHHFKRHRWTVHAETGQGKLYECDYTTRTVHK